MIENSPLQKIESKLFEGHQIWVKRDDLLHPQISGNKYRKLQYALPTYQPSLVVSMGGPWSNHLHALAYACYERGWPSYGFIRGLRSESLSLPPTLLECRAWGMQLHFVSRITYRQLREDPQYWRSLLPSNSSEALWISEGGRGHQALRGLQAIPTEVKRQLGKAPDFIVSACGTGTTIAGLVLGSQINDMHNTHILGICAVSNSNHLYKQIGDLLRDENLCEPSCYQLLQGFDHGGFAKTSPALINFCRQFIVDTNIPIEPVYTGKMFFAISQLCRQGFFRDDDRIVALHTGGLQGARSQQLE